MNKHQKEVLQSQLNSEEDVIKELNKVYKQALDDCKTKIELLSARAELNPDNLQSIIYQKNFQEAIKAQLEGVMVGLDSDAYSTISEYLANCYEEGYVGVMYDLASQGIPLVMPIDPKDVMKAIQTDSQLSSSLYTRLGEDVKELKKAVSSELSRGIANGSTWNQVAANLASNFKNTPFSKAYNSSIRIARTEGHRVQIQSALDAQYKAKEKGADVVKQWDSTLDGKTRDTHRKLDGQIREVDEPFEVDGMKADAPGMFGDPAEDCNCRCALLQRARWALDEDELQTLQDRADYFGLDKSDSFDDFKDKYLKISQDDIDALEKNEKSSTIGASAGIGKNEVYYNANNDYTINIEGLDEAVNKELSITAESVASLGSEDRCEHMYLVDLSGETSSYYETNGEPSSVGHSFWNYAEKHKEKQFAFIHNHNTDSSLSQTDLETPILCENIPIQIAVTNDGVKYIAHRKKLAPAGYYADSYFANELEEINAKSRNGEITPIERMNQREEIIIECLIKEFYEGVDVIDGRKQ